MAAVQFLDPRDILPHVRPTNDKHISHSERKRRLRRASLRIFNARVLPAGDLGISPEPNLKQSVQRELLRVSSQSNLQVSGRNNIEILRQAAVVFPSGRNFDSIISTKHRG